MIKMILITLSAVLAVLGLSEVIHAIRLLVLAPKKHPQTVTVVRLSGDEPLRQLHYAGNALTWNETSAENAKLAVCSLPAGKLLEECRETAERYDILLCSENELLHYFENSEVE